MRALYVTCEHCTSHANTVRHMRTLYVTCEDCTWIRNKLPRLGGNLIQERVHVDPGKIAVVSGDFRVGVNWCAYYLRKSCYSKTHVLYGDYRPHANNTTAHRSCIVVKGKSVPISKAEAYALGGLKIAQLIAIQIGVFFRSIIDRN